MLKGLFLGVWLASFFTIGFLWFRLFRYALGGMVDVRAVRIMTIQNWLWWAGLIVCFVAAFMIVRSWPGRPVFWVLLGITELIPVGLLALFLVMVARLKEANDAIKSIR